jgi:glucose/arabinose dehydrogenase
MPEGSRPVLRRSVTPDCSGVATEQVAFVIGDTPFGLDFEPGLWPEPYKKNMLVTLHGVVGDYTGERVVAVPTGADGMPKKSSDLGTSTLTEFAGGWDNFTTGHGRPAAVTFAPDGRAFIANDANGDIFWVAPVGLKMK